MAVCILEHRNSAQDVARINAAHRIAVAGLDIGPPRIAADFGCLPNKVQPNRQVVRIQRNSVRIDNVGQRCCQNLPDIRGNPAVKRGGIADRHGAGGKRVAAANRHHLIGELQLFDVFQQIAVVCQQAAAAGQCHLRRHAVDDPPNRCPNRPGIAVTDRDKPVAVKIGRGSFVTQCIRGGAIQVNHLRDALDVVFFPCALIKRSVDVASRTGNTGRVGQNFTHNTHVAGVDRAVQHQRVQRPPAKGHAGKVGRAIGIGVEHLARILAHRGGVGAH